MENYEETANVSLMTCILSVCDKHNDEYVDYIAMEQLHGVFKVTNVSQEQIVSDGENKALTLWSNTLTKLQTEKSQFRRISTIRINVENT